MLVNSLKLIYFSPTGTTKKVLEAIADGIAPETIEHIDLSTSNTDLQVKKNQNDLVLIGMPTYASRIPPEAAKLLEKIHADAVPAVLVAVYGNNRFGDVLLEMKNIAISNGFVPVSAAAFIGEHSFSTKDKPIAAGRPDVQDLNDAEKFGESIRKKMLEYDFIPANNDLDIPGNLPYREWNKIQSQPPQTDKNSCVKCSKCESICPVNAISIKQEVITDPELCIFCSACIKECQNESRAFTDSKLLEITDRLHNSCLDRKIPEIFL